MAEVEVVFGGKPNHDITEELISGVFRAAQTRLVGRLGAARLQWEVAELGNSGNDRWRAKLRWQGAASEEDVTLFRNALSLVTLVGSSHCRVDWLGS
jgi:hypothetical protein